MTIAINNPPHLIIPAFNKIKYVVRSIQFYGTNFHKEFMEIGISLLNSNSLPVSWETIYMSTINFNGFVYKVIHMDVTTYPNSVEIDIKARHVYETLGQRNARIHEGAI